MSSSLLDAKCVVIIGGTSGIGLSAATACIKAGAQVVVTGIDAAAFANSKKMLNADTPVILSDASIEGSAEQAIESCISAYGRFDGLYHVAGGSGRRFGDGILDQMTLEGWNKTLELNLTSVMLSNRAAIRYFLQKDSGGAIVNMSSVLGFAPSPAFFYTHAYAAAKSAINGFSRSVAAFYATNNIRVNVIAPALVETPMSGRAIGDPVISSFVKSKQPLDGGRAGVPQDLDGLAVFLLSDAAKFITGQVISVDGGWALTDGQIPK